MKIKLPVLIINLKEYEEVLGERAIKFAKIAKKLSKKFNISILIAPPPPLLDEVAKITLTISQHIDPYEPGAHTGALLAKEVKVLGGIGSLINHSEKRITFEEIKKCIKLCKKYKLISIVCSKDIREAKKIAKLKPDFIAIEPPELIGGEVSISTAKPQIIEKTVKAVKKISKNTVVLCGAGIKSKEDVKKAMELGAKGILVASGVVKSKNIEKSMKELIKGML